MNVSRMFLSDAGHAYCAKHAGTVATHPVTLADVSPIPGVPGERMECCRCDAVMDGTAVTTRPAPTMLREVAPPTKRPRARVVV